MKRIIIVGCGITGMMTSLAFAKKGLETHIYEKVKSEKFPPDVRTTTFTSFSKEYMDEIGIWDLLKEESGFVRDIYIVDNKSPKMLHLPREENCDRGLVLPNDFIKNVLYAEVKRNKLVKLHKGVEYKNSKDDIVLACDGRQSQFSSLFETRVNKSYNQAAIVLVCEHELDHDNVAVEHFMPKGPFAALPMKNQKQSSIVWSEPLETAEIFKSMEKQKLEQHLQEKMGDYLGKVKIASEVQIFPLTAKVTKNYYKDNIVLIGDSAHGIHPLAGQGLNQGIKDIKAIVEIFSKRLELGLEIDELALSQYEKERSKDNFLMYKLTDMLNSLFCNDSLTRRAFRRFGLAFLDEFSGLKKLISKYGTGLGI